MAKYRAYAVVTATKYIGEFEANSSEEAEQMAWESENAHVSICYHCAKEVDGAELTEMFVEVD